MEFLVLVVALAIDPIRIIIAAVAAIFIRRQGFASVAVMALGVAITLHLLLSSMQPVPADLLVAGYPASLISVSVFWLIYKYFSKMKEPVKET